MLQPPGSKLRGNAEVIWLRRRSQGCLASPIRVPQEAAGVASESLASGQRRARDGRIYALELLGDG